MKVKKEQNIFGVAMKSELDILNYGGHDYLLSASALPLEEHLFQPHFSILGKTNEDDVVWKTCQSETFWKWRRKIMQEIFKGI